MKKRQHAGRPGVFYPMRRVIAAFFCICLLITAVAGCTPRQPEDPPRFRIVTSFYPMYIMALKMGLMASRWTIWPGSKRGVCMITSYNPRI